MRILTSLICKGQATQFSSNLTARALEVPRALGVWHEWWSLQGNFHSNKLRKAGTCAFVFRKAPQRSHQWSTGWLQLWQFLYRSQIRKHLIAETETQRMACMWSRTHKGCVNTASFTFIPLVLCVKLGRLARFDG